MAWCPTQPDLVATGGADDRAFIWRVGQDAYEQTGGATLELGGHTDTVCALAFNAAGDALASGGMDGRVKVWEAASGRCIQTLEGPGEAVEWVRWHPKGNVVLAGAADFTAWMWLAQTGACMQVGTGARGPHRQDGCMHWTMHARHAASHRVSICCSSPAGCMAGGSQQCLAACLAPQLASSPAWWPARPSPAMVPPRLLPRRCSPGTAAR